MRHLYFALFGWMILCLLFSCSTAAPGLFTKQSLHEQYGKKLTDAGLNQTAIGLQWFAAAETALQHPSTITVPYKEAGYFSAEKPRAVGLKFAAKRGEKLTIQFSKHAAAAFALYADLWKAAPKPVLKISFDTTKQSVEFEATENSDYIIQLQPELLSSGTYTLSISIGPSLGFPVAGKSAHIGSVWGDARDAGYRRHEGVDIFAPKRTPAIAAADGIITTVNENTLGGKAVWLRPQKADYVLYYAHLDEQSVHEQQQVYQGDSLGLVGNTGNARTTPSHLHFGIYISGGAIDPLPFINPVIKQAQDADTQLFKKAIRFAANTTLENGEKSTPVKAQTFATPVAITATTYRIVFPDGTNASVPIKATMDATQPLRIFVLRDTVSLLEQPQPEATRITTLFPSNSILLLGFFNGFALVQTKTDGKGWVFEKVVKQSASHKHH